MTIFDTHAHYDDERFDPDREELLSSMPGRGVKLILNPGCDEKSSREAAGFAERFDFVYAAAGIHPGNAGKERPDFIRAIPNIRAVGEIGLDYHYPEPDREIQKRLFDDQLGIAEELKLPVIIHCRDAYADTLDVLKARRVRAVFHCYSGSAEFAKAIVKLGHYVSFTGAATFKNAKKALETAAILPAERIMTETDAPYMAPEPFRGKRCDSAMIEYTLRVLAAARGEDAEELAARTFKNGTEFFGIEYRI